MLCSFAKALMELELDDEAYKIPEKKFRKISRIHAYCIGGHIDENQCSTGQNRFRRLL